MTFCIKNSKVVVKQYEKLPIKLLWNAISADLRGLILKISWGSKLPDPLAG